jgi:hypothetical protein
MENINEYILRPYSERVSHLDLNLMCREIGGNSTSFKGLLSHILNTTIPKGNKILLCHKCHNPKCSNPNHLYYGTPKENIQDQIENGTWKPVWEKMIEKYGYDGACKINAMGNKIAGGLANKGIAKSEQHKKKISESIKKIHQNKKK